MSISPPHLAPAVAAPGAAEQPSRSELRLQSISWALASGLGAALVGLMLQGQLEAALRSGGCGLFYGLLAFHLHRVDPDDSHLQAGLVGALCGICSLVSPIQVTEGLSTVMMDVLRGWLPLWLPLVGSALLLRVVSRLMRS